MFPCFFLSISIALTVVAAEDYNKPLDIRVPRSPAPASDASHVDIKHLMLVQGLNASKAVDLGLQMLKGTKIGGLLYFAAGTYEFDAPMNLSAALNEESESGGGQTVAVAGDGAGVTILVFSSDGGMFFQHTASNVWDHLQSSVAIRDLTVAKAGADSVSNSHGSSAAIAIQRLIFDGSKYSYSGGTYSTRITNVHIGSAQFNSARWHQGVYLQGGAVQMNNVMCNGEFFLGNESFPADGNAAIFIEPGPATGFRYQFANMYLLRWREGIHIKSSDPEPRIEGLYITNMEAVGVYIGVQVSGTLVGLQIANSHIDFAYSGFKVTDGSATNWKLIGNYFTQNTNGEIGKPWITGGAGVSVKAPGQLFRSQIVGNTIETISGTGDHAVDIDQMSGSVVQMNTFGGAWKHGPRCLDGTAGSTPCANNMIHDGPTMLNSALEI